MTTIKLTGIGRAKINREIVVDNPLAEGKRKYSLEQMVVRACLECRKYLFVKSIDLYQVLGKEGTWEVITNGEKFNGIVEINYEV